MRKTLLTLTILLTSTLFAGKQDLSKVYQKQCWKKYKFIPVLAMQFCPTQDEIRKTLASK